MAFGFGGSDKDKDRSLSGRSAGGQSSAGNRSPQGSSGGHAGKSNTSSQGKSSSGGKTGSSNSGSSQGQSKSSNTSQGNTNSPQGKSATSSGQSGAGNRTSQGGGNGHASRAEAGSSSPQQGRTNETRQGANLSNMGVRSADIDPARFGRTVADIDPARFGRAAPAPAESSGLFAAAGQSTGTMQAPSYNSARMFESATVPDNGLYSAAGDVSYRQAEISSMDAYDRMRTTDQASEFRAAENTSMDTYDRMKAADSADRVRQTDLASQARAAENDSMSALAGEWVMGTLRKAEAGVKDQYNRLPSGVGKTHANLTGMSVRDAISLASTMKRKGAEANVIGAYQFKDETLNGIAEKLGVMDEAFTPQMQDRLAQALFQERADRATVNGEIDVDKFAGELAKEWASLATTEGVSHYDKNGIDKASVSYDQVHDMAKSLVDYGIVSSRKSAKTAAPTFADRYLSLSPVQDRISIPAAQVGTSPGLFGQPTSGFGAIPTNALPATRTATTVAPVQPAARVSPAPAAPAPRAGALPASTVPAPAATPPVNSSPSIGEQVLGGAIDVLGGLIPGIGIGVSVANGGLMLAGEPTIGQTLADILTGGGGVEGPYERLSERGDGTYRLKAGKPPVQVAASPAEIRFVETYLSPYVDDGIQRPTPHQKWELGRDTYGQAGA